MFIEKVKGFKKPRFFQKRLFVIAILSVGLAGAVFSLTASMKTVTVFDGEDYVKIQTMSNDPETILAKAGITLLDEDRYEFCGPNGKITAVTVFRAFDVSVEADGIIVQVKMTNGTVAEAIEKAAVPLEDTDILNVSEDAAVYSGMVIDVTRVGYQYIQQEHFLAHATSAEYTDALHKGISKTITAGTDGLKVVTIRQKLADGKVVEETTVKEEIVREPVNEKTLIGTKEAVSSKGSSSSAAKMAAASSAVALPAGAINSALTPVIDLFKTYSKLAPPSALSFDGDGRPLQYKQLITGKASAYYQDPNIHSTATGRPLMAGHVAVDPKQIPYGSKLWIRTANGKTVYGYAIAADTGGFVKRGRIMVDLFFGSESECISFGVKDVEIYILD